MTQASVSLDDQYHNEDSKNNVNKVEKIEREWAIAIKAAAQRHSDIDASIVSDLEYLQYAIFTQGNVPDALKRLALVQDFKRRYGIHDDGSWEEGIRDLETFLRAFPDYLCSFGIHPGDQSCFSCLRPVESPNGAPENVPVFMRFWFYHCQATQSSIATMRAGVVTFADMRGMTCRHFAPQIKKELGKLFGSYPVRNKSAVLIHMNYVARLFIFFFNLFRTDNKPEKFTCYRNAKIFLNHSFVPPNLLPPRYGGTMDDERLRASLLENLQARYRLAETFTL